MREHFPRQYIKLEHPANDLPPYDGVAWIKFDRVLLDGEFGRCVIKAMAFFNDFQSSSCINNILNESNVLTTKHRAMMRYWSFRMSILSLHECMTFISHLVLLPEAMSYLDIPILSQNYKLFEKYLCVNKIEGPNYKDFKKLIKTVRNWLGGHLDAEQLERAMSKRSESPRFTTGRVQYSDKPFGSRFFCADDICMTVMWHNAWGVSGRVEEIDEEIDRNILEVMAIANPVYNFIGQFADIVAKDRRYFY